MNREKQFLNQIDNNSGNCNRLIDSILGLINQDSSLTSRKSFFTRFFRRAQKSAYNIIDENFVKIFNKMNNSGRQAFLGVLMKRENYVEIIVKNLDLVIETMTADKENIFNIKEFYDSILDYNIDFVEENLRRILEETKAPCFFTTISYFKAKRPCFESNVTGIINRQMNTRTKDIAISMLSRAVQKFPAYLDEREIMSTNKDIEDYSTTLEIMIKELLADQHKSPSDIVQIGVGSSTNVYLIGNKVLKVGAPKVRYNIPNHKRILQPLTRKNFTSRNGCPFVNVEITDYVSTYIDQEAKRKVAISSLKEDGKIENAENLSDDDILYLLYKEFRDSGILITDFAWRNLGVLQKENTPTLHNQKIKVSPNSVGLYPPIENDTLGKGEIVYIDLEHIYKEDDKNINWPCNSKSQLFELRYQREKNITQKIQDEMER